MSDNSIIPRRMIVILRRVMGRGLAGLLCVMGAASVAACMDDGPRRVTSQGVEDIQQSPFAPGYVVAVAPALNLSGSRDFDVLVVSDTLFGELQQVNGLTALPLNRTLLAMRKLGVRAIDSPETAGKVAAAVGANAMIVPAVTAYDPYNPPTMGMTLESYPAAGVAGPRARVSAVFNATNQSVLRELRDFAQGRTVEDSALEDQRYVLDTDLYMRFVCHAMVRRLLEVQRPGGSDR